MALLLLLFIVVPLVELYVIVEVAGALGIVPTLLLLFGVSLLGSLLVRRQGLGVVRRARQVWATGNVPTEEVLDGVLIVLAGALMLTPGFVTDLVGLALLVPVGRSLVRRGVLAGLWARLRLPMAGVTFVGGAAANMAANRRAQRVFVGEAVVVDDSADRLRRPALSEAEGPPPPGGS